MSIFDEFLVNLSNKQVKDHALAHENDPSKFEHSEAVLDDDLAQQVMRTEVLKNDIEKLNQEIELLYKEREYRLAQTAKICSIKYPDIDCQFKFKGFRVFKGKAFIVAWEKK